MLRVVPGTFTGSKLIVPRFKLSAHKEQKGYFRMQRFDCVSMRRNIVKRKTCDSKLDKKVGLKNLLTYLKYKDKKSV